MVNVARVVDQAHRDALAARDRRGHVGQLQRPVLEAGDVEALVRYQSLGPDARQSVPTPEHFLPLLYVLGTRQPSDRVTFPVEGFDGGSISMLAVQVG